MVIQPLSHGEKVLVAAYEEAMKGAFDATNKAAETVTTFALAVVTGYGALIGLVQPKTSAAPLIVGAPFAIFALAAGTAIASRLIGVPISIVNDLDKIRGILKGRIRRKRIMTAAAVTIVVIGIALAGYIVVTAYH